MTEIQGRIKGCLTASGMMSLPETEDDRLENFGYDSLIKAMTIISIEREFGIKILLEDLDHYDLECLKGFYQLVQDKLESRGRS